MEEAEKIFTSRKISASSVKTYMSILRSILRGVNADSIDVFADNPKKIIEHLKDLPLNTRKTKLSAVVSLLSCNENDKHKEACGIYRENMQKDIEAYDEFVSSQRKTDKQAENWKEWEDLKKVADDIADQVRPIMSRDTKSKPLTNDERELFRRYLVTLFYVHMEPRRLLDWVAMRLKGEPIQGDNFIDSTMKNAIFTNYKTAKKYGTQKVALPPRVRMAVKFWRNNTPPDHLYVFHDKKGNRFSQPQMNILINQTFGKRIGVNGLRHSRLSHLYKDTPALAEMKKRAQDMGHSVEMALGYVKHD